MGRLELPRVAPLPPQSSVSTNSTTSAILLREAGYVKRETYIEYRFTLHEVRFTFIAWAPREYRLMPVSPLFQGLQEHPQARNRKRLAACPLVYPAAQSQWLCLRQIVALPPQAAVACLLDE